MLDVRSDRGQAMPLILAVVALAVVVMLALVPLARGAADRAQARTAADAAALAGAAEGEAAAREVAEANGGLLLGWKRAGLAVLVVVQVGDAVARAKAEVVVPSAPAAGAAPVG